MGKEDIAGMVYIYGKFYLQASPFSRHRRQLYLLRGGDEEQPDIMPTQSVLFRR